MTVEEAADSITIHADSYYCGLCGFETTSYDEYADCAWYAVKTKDNLTKGCPFLCGQYSALLKYEC